jgi:DNA invertase Pin-like site-specific DNA recombinase
MRVVALTRTSTEDQRLGCDAQEALIRSECERRGWELAMVHTEEGKSGRGSDRPGLSLALSMIAAGDADALMVAKLDRLSRSVVDFGHIIAWLEQAGGSLIALDLGVDTTTAAGRLVANVLASVAQWEAEAGSERTSAALRALQARGGTAGRPAVPEAVAARIRALRSEGLSLRAVADALNEERVPTVRGAARWSVSSVQTAAGYRRPRRRRAADLPPMPTRRRAALT